MPNVAIVIVNWNGWKDTIECLDSLLKITYPSFEIVVVDNGSTDNSVEYIKRWAQKKVPVILENFQKERFSKVLKEDNEIFKNSSSKRRLFLISLSENLGFSGGNNIGIKRALQNKNDYILLLNNDTFVDEDFLTQLVHYALKDERIGILGCKVYYAYPKNKLWYAGGTLHSIKPGGRPYGQNELDYGQYDEVKEVTFVTGAAMLVKSEVFRDIGLLDERFFFGMEDYDFCKRVIRKGYSILYVPYAKIWHKVGSSRKNLGVSDLYRGYKTNIIYMKKHLPLFVWIPWLFLYSIYLLVFSSYTDSNTFIDKKIHRKAIISAIKEGILSNAVTKSDIRVETWD